MDEVKLIKFPKELDINFAFFNFICDLYDKYSQSEFESIIFDFTETKWIDANLVAVLKSIIDLLRERYNTVNIRNMSIQIKMIFMKNGFLNQAVKDVNKTTMEM